MSKQKYRVRNWKEYNASLVKRGGVTLWFDEESISLWNSTVKTGKKGRPQVYSDLAIKCALTIGMVFNLPLRAIEGFVSSLILQLGLDINCPDYTTLSKRQKDLEIELTKKKLVNSFESLHIVVDSTGLKVFGEGEWKVRQHGYSKRRTWRKLHLAVDSNSHIIESAVLSSNDFKDSEILPDLLEPIDGKIDKVSGDGGYDSHSTYEYIESLDATPLIPPRKDAVISQHGNSNSPPLPRDEVLRSIRKKGRKKWKKDSGYHKRSLAETAMFRIKTIFGASLRARIFENQATEAFIKCLALNKMTSLGMPESYPV